MYHFYEFLINKDEIDLINRLPYLDPVQQAKIDIFLHKDAIQKGTFDKYNYLLGNDIGWKYKVIDIFQGKETDPKIIKQTIDIIRKDINSHMNRGDSRIIGSNNWHKVWIGVYEKWLDILGEKDGT
jgi:hypothetical protein